MFRRRRANVRPTGTYTDWRWPPAPTATGKIAIFSIWGAKGATGPSMAGTFGGEVTDS